MIDIERLTQRRDELRQVEAQAIHALGVAAGRLEEIESLIQQLADSEKPQTVED